MQKTAKDAIPIPKLLKNILSLTAAVLFTAALCCCAGCANAPSASNATASSNTAVTEAANTQPANASQESSSVSAQAETTTQDDQQSSTQSPSGSTLTVRFLDVGQGDAALLDCDGHWLLIDGGPSSASSKLYSLIKKLGITQLDYIVASHADADHVGGIAGALNAAPCGQLFCCVDSADTKTFNNMVKYLNRSSHIGITTPAVGTQIQLGAATVTFVGPTRTFDTDNDRSLVVRVDFGSTSFLFTGDAETASETAMVSDGANLDVDVLKVGHHGSAKSSTLPFLRAVSPAYAIISVGENTYGHPTDTALRNLASVNTQVMRTDQAGDITFTSDGTTLSYTTEHAA